MPKKFLDRCLVEIERILCGYDRRAVAKDLKTIPRNAVENIRAFTHV